MAEGNPAAPRPPRRALVISLVVVGSLLGFLTISALWINRQALDTENWASSSSQLLESSAVREQVAAYLVDELYTSVDVPAQLSEALPPRAQPLAGPAAGGLRTLADRGMEQLLQRPRVQALWEEANRGAQKRLLQVVEGREGDLSIQGGSVTLDLGAVLTEAAQSLGVGAKLAGKVPPGTAQITILHSDQLGTAQAGLKAFRGLTIVLLILCLASFVTAVAVAGRRREALRMVGAAFILIGVAVLIARHLAGNAVVDSLSGTAAVKPAVADVWRIGTSQLQVAAESTIAYGVVMVVAAWLGGFTTVAVGARARLAPYLNDRRYAYGALVVLIALLLAWQPTPATGKPLGMLLLALLLAAGIEALRRQTDREHPNAPAPAPAHALRQAFARAGARNGSSHSNGSPDPLERLERLGRLHDSGVIDDDELAREKGRMLGAAPQPAEATEQSPGSGSAPPEP